MSDRRLNLLVAGLALLLASCSPVTVEPRGPRALPSAVDGWLGRTYPPGVVVHPVSSAFAVPGQPNAVVHFRPRAICMGGLGATQEIFSLHNEGSRPIDWVACDIGYLGQGEFIHSVGRMTYATREYRSRFLYRGRLAPGERQECMVMLWRGECSLDALGGGAWVRSVSSGTGKAPREGCQVALPYFGPKALLSDGRISAEGLARFQLALDGAEHEHERIGLLGMLLAAVQSGDPDGLPAVVQPEFARVLAGMVRPGRALPSPLPREAEAGGGLDPEANVNLSARTYAKAALLSLVPPGLLAEHRRAIAGLADGKPGGTDLELIAKARAVEALPAVRKAGFPPGRDGELLRLAVLGALGDAPSAEKLVDDFRKERDPARRLEMIHYLGVLATREALRAVAGELRSPFELEDGKLGTRRMRFEAVDALRISHPENRLCYTPRLRTDADWEALEKFCAEEYGATFSGERPPPPKESETPEFGLDATVVPDQPDQSVQSRQKSASSAADE